MDCAEVNEKIELYVLGGLDKLQHAAVKAHLAICPACKAVETDYRLLIAAIKEAGWREKPRFDFANRVRSAIKVEPQATTHRSLARHITAVTASVAACLLFGLVIWQGWISPGQSRIANHDTQYEIGDKRLDGPSVLQASPLTRGALSVRMSRADDIVVHRGQMYLLQDSGCGTYVAALDIKTGKRKWLSDIQSCGYLLADDSRVYCLTQNRAGEFDLIALDVTNGKMLWKYPQQ